MDLAPARTMPPAAPPLSATPPAATRTAVAIASHPLHVIAVNFPIAYLTGALASDLAFWWTGDPFWARVSLWLAGAGFAIGALAALFGTLEFLLVREIRQFVSSWSHFLAGITLLSIAAANWWGRIEDPVAAVLPWGLVLSVVGAIGVGWAGWLGGKLVFEHNIGTGD
jgi:uncharacterized membrane protein